ncbi:MAG: hypothetical protein H7Y07_02320, partial [Pyrinomonadaceae bacterium]|nr:hypothetical protein [Sphingobacteriaceae bacterium]
MKRSLLVIFIFIQWCGLCYAQQYALYNTRTLFDAFENPSQKAFIPDSSKKYAFNFFVPNLSFSSEFKGNMPAQTTLKKILFKRIFDASNLINTSGMNNFYADQNTYLVMLRIFGNVYLNSEKGFAWQIKTDIRGTVSNETLAILHNSNLFTSGTPYEDVLNNSLNGISYHQFSFSYRENYSKRLGLGIKLSYLSGIGYSSLSMDKSEVLVDQLNNTYDVSLKGKYRTNILLNDPGDKIIQPGIKNPGLAIGISANYKLHRGWYLLGNLKDLGFI